MQIRAEAGQEPPGPIGDVVAASVAFPSQTDGDGDLRADDLGDVLAFLLLHPLFFQAEVEEKGHGPVGQAAEAAGVLLRGFQLHVVAVDLQDGRPMVGDEAAKFFDGHLQGDGRDQGLLDQLGGVACPLEPGTAFRLGGLFAAAAAELHDHVPALRLGHQQGPVRAAEHGFRACRRAGFRSRRSWP